MEEENKKKKNHKILNITFGVVIGILLASTITMSVLYATKGSGDKPTPTPTITSYSVFYSADGKTVYSEVVESGKNVTNVPNVPDKTGYTGVWDNDGKNITADKVIYAVYTPVAKSYKIDLNKKNVSGTKSIKDIMDESESITFGLRNEYPAIVSGVTPINVGETASDEVFAYIVPKTDVSKYDLYFLADSKIVIENNDLILAYSSDQIKKTVDTYAELEALDKSGFADGDIVEVTHDETFYGVKEYYAFDSSLDKFNYDSADMSPFSLLLSTKKISFRNVDTSNMTDFSYFLGGNDSLEYVDLGDLDTSSGLVFDGMFSSNSSLIYADLSLIDTSSALSLQQMFFMTFGLKSFDVDEWDVSSVENMFGLFEATSIEEVDLSSWETDSVKDMGCLFDGSSSLNSVNFGNNFNTQNVIDMHGMFCGCANISTLDISSFDTSKVTDMNNFVSGCKQLTTLTVDATKFDTSKVKDFSNFFRDSDLLVFDYNLLDTSSAEYMSYMFAENDFTKIDISDFDFTNVVDTSYMFWDCKQLKTIFVKDGTDLTSVSTGDGMFYNCTNIVGAEGTPYDGSKSDQQYARVDSAPNLGYFSVHIETTFQGHWLSTGAANISNSYVEVNGVKTYFKTEGDELTTIDGTFKEGDTIKIYYQLPGYDIEVQKCGKDYSTKISTIYKSTASQEYTFTAEGDCKYYITFGFNEM